MSTAAKALAFSRVIVRTPQEQQLDTVRALKALNARTRAQNKSLLGKKSDRHYNPAKDMLAPAARPGADDALAIPSRFSDRLHYRDGRVIPVSARKAS